MVGAWQIVHWFALVVLCGNGSCHTRKLMYCSQSQETATERVVLSKQHVTSTFWSQIFMRERESIICEEQKQNSKFECEKREKTEKKTCVFSLIHLKFRKWNLSILIIFLDPKDWFRERQFLHRPLAAIVGRGLRNDIAWRKLKK